MLFGLLAVYVFNIRYFSEQLSNRFWIHLVAFLNLGACALNLATLTTRFVFPQFSLEGKRLWIVGMAPLGLMRVVLAKFWALAPKVLLLDEPTRGVDVGTKSEIYQLIRQRAAAGTGVIVVSSELPELLGLCDRILVMHEGRMAGVFDAATTTESELLHACYGRNR